jgi:hypothetical protein
MRKPVPLIFFIILTLSAFGQDKQEVFKINWSEEYKWKIITDLDDELMHFIEFIPENEDSINWAMLYTLMTLKNEKVSTTGKIVQMYRELTYRNSPDAKLTVLERDNKAKNIWVLFKVERLSYPNDPGPLSKLYYVIQGDTNLFVNYITIKEETLSTDFISKWMKVFKNNEIIYQ